MLIATSELPDDALVVARVGQADAQDGEAFRGAGADVVNFQVGGHGSFLQRFVGGKTSVGGTRRGRKRNRLIHFELGQ